LQGIQAWPELAQPTAQVKAIEVPKQTLSKQRFYESKSIINSPYFGIPIQVSSLAEYHCIFLVQIGGEFEEDGRKRFVFLKMAQ
jgi:hypothetical protein